MKTARPTATAKLVASLVPRAPSGSPVRLITSALVVSALVGCGSSAGIRRTDGNIVEAKIVGSDPDGLQLEGASGQTYRMDGRTVVDIDHPGNVAMVAGALLLAEFASLMTSGDFRRELINGPHGDGMVAARPLTAMFGVPGALLLGYGTYRYLSSTRAAAAFVGGYQRAAERPLPSAQAAPPRRSATAAGVAPRPSMPSFASTAEPQGQAGCERTRLASFCPRP